MQNILILLLLSLSTLHTASGCYQSENIECSCTNTTISCSGIQREYDEMKDILLNITTSYSTTDFLYLDWNIKNLTLESNITFGYLKLKYLTLSSDLEDLPDNLFSGLELTLISLNLQYNNFDTMDNQPFSSLGVLKELLLDFNNFHTINADLFASLSKLEVLSLSKNKLNSLDIDFLNLPEIQTLNLDNNNFSAISDIKIKSDALKNLHVQNCSVKGTLEKDSLQYVLNLENLDLSFNQLLGMNSFALSNLKHLKILNVSHNSMEYLKDNALSALQDLTSLDLKNNKLLLVAEKAFLNLVNLKYIDLSRNRLEVFLHKYTVDLYLLESVNLEDNKIKQITSGTFSISKNLKEIFLKGNIFDCTCELSYFVGYLVNNSHITLNDTDDAICNSPPEMKGKSLIEMDIESMKCENLDIDTDFPFIGDDDYDGDYYADTTTYISTTENLNTTTDGSVPTTENLNTTSDGSLLTTENLNTTDGSLLTTENLKTTTDGSVLTTVNLNTTDGSLLTTENLKTTTGGSVLTTVNLNTTTDGSVPTTENLNTTTDGSLLTTENLKTTTDGSLLTTENLKTTTDGSVLTTENLNTTTDDSVLTTENLITLTNDLFETTKENTPSYTSENSVSTIENQITSTTSQSSTAESAFTYTTIKSETESLTTTADSSIMNTTVLPSTENINDFISDLNSTLNTTASSNTNDYIPTISTTELQNITTQSPEPKIQILDSFISEEKFCVRWKIDKNLVGVNKCGLQTQGLNGKKVIPFVCSISDKGSQKCVSIFNVYKLCLNIYFADKSIYQFCPEIPKLSTSPKSSSENTTVFSAISTTHMLTTHLPSEIPTTSSVMEKPTTLPSLDSTTISSSSESTISSSSLTPSPESSTVFPTSTTPIPKLSTSPKSSSETTTIFSAISTTHMLTTHLPSEIPTTSSVMETPTTSPSLDSTTISSSSESTISSSSLTPSAESSTVFPTSTTPIHSTTEFQITQTEAKVTKVHFKLISFDLTVDHDKSIALAKWTVSKKEPLSMCNLMLTIASKGYNKTLGTFNCASSHHKIFSVEDFAFFKVCLRVSHKLYATRELCKSFSGLPYQLKAVKTKDAGYTNSSFIALTCLLLVVLLIIIVLVLKKVLKKRGESDRYNVCDQEKKIQRRISHKRPESCVRYSYTVKDQEEIQL